MVRKTKVSEASVSALIERLAADVEDNTRKLRAKRDEVTSTMVVAERVRSALPTEHFQQAAKVIAHIDFELMLLAGLREGRVRQVLVDGQPTWIIDEPAAPDHGEDGE